MRRKGGWSGQPRGTQGRCAACLSNIVLVRIDAALPQPVNMGGGYSPPDQQEKLQAFSRCRQLCSHWIASISDKSEDSPKISLKRKMLEKKALFPPFLKKLGFVKKIQDRRAMDYSVCSIAGCGIPGHQDGNRKMCKMNCPSGVCVSCALRPPPPLPAAAGLPQPHADFSLAIN